MEDLEELAGGQGGVLSSAQLRAAGVRPVRSDLVVPVRRGVWTTTARWSATGDAERAALSVAGERLLSGVDLVGVARTAALVHGLPLYASLPRRVEVCERRELRPAHHGVSRRVDGDDVVEVLGVPVTSLARTTVDVARRRGRLAGVVVADAALRRGVTRAELGRVLERSHRWPGRLTAVDAVAFADPGAETPLESLGRVRFAEHGLPAPEQQVVVSDVRGPFARVDHCWRDRRTVAEADGALKYEDAAALFREKQREDRLRDAGWEVVRYTWGEVVHTPHVVVSRVLRAFARAARRRAA